MNRLPLLVLVTLFGCGEPEESWGAVGGFNGSTTRQALDAKPALTGTSVVALSDGRIAVVDPDSDAVFLVNRKPQSKLKVTFPKHSAPTRAVEAGTELAVVLRGSGQLARIPLGTGSTEADPALFEQACAEPRGVAFDVTTQSVKLACASGELVTFGPTGRSAVDTGLELRDVLVVSGSTWATTFRTAELVQLDAKGAVTARLQPPDFQVPLAHFRPHVAWRAVTDGKRVLMLHQLHVAEEVTRLTNPGPGAPYYGSVGCTTSVVTSAVTAFDTSTKKVEWSAALTGAVPVDLAVDGTGFAVATLGAGTLNEYDAPVTSFNACLTPRTVMTSGAPTGVTYVNHVATWFDHGGRLFVGDVTPGASTRVLDERALDPARATFHVQSPSGVSCASCHPEGYDDGHTWVFGPRVVRSQTLEGGLLETAPYHWDGHLRSLSDVLGETFVSRMGGVVPDTSTERALGEWLDSVPARRVPVNAPRLAKLGRGIFERSGCAGCHSGPELTNGSTVDVGTGAAYQVPTLKALRYRGPWMHDGCAQTLEQRFDPACGGTRHGGKVAPDEVADLVEYLNTL